MTVGASLVPDELVRLDRDDAFRAFFAGTFPALAGYCASLVGGRAAGEDLAQEALVRTWGRWLSVRRPQAYVYLVATNLARRRWRDTRREEQALQLLADRGDQLSDGFAVRDLVERLPERLRAPVLLHYYADLPVAEVARLLHRPVGTIKQRLHEARHRLAEQYEEQP